MKISAFTIIKNAELLDYPIIESINSLLPYVDEYIVNVGDEEEYNQLSDYFASQEKIFLFYSEWAGKENGTQFFSEETNKALDECNGDWCFYLQADECVADWDGEQLQEWIDKAEKQNKQGITFKYEHFVDKNHVMKTYSDGADFYELEIRLFKNNGLLRSFGDGQSFSFLDQLTDYRGPQPALHRKELFLDSDMKIYHYGYMKSPEKLLEKKKYLRDFYDRSEPGRQEVIPEKDDKYIIDSSKIKEFNGKHPSVMTERLKRFE